MIHYQNPKIIAGCVVLEQEKVLLCKRAIEPRYGLWTLPAGLWKTEKRWPKLPYARLGRKRVQPLILINYTSLHQYQELVRYTCCIWHSSITSQYNSGPESLETRLFPMDEIPWDELAFHTVRDTLIQLKQDLEVGSFSLHCIDREETQTSARV